MTDEGIKAKPVGRILRLLTAVALIVEGSGHLIGTSMALVAKTTGVIAGEFVFYAVLHLVISKFFRRVNPWLGAILAVAPVALVFILSPAPGKLGTLIFIGVSLLFSALRADGGCEVLTLPGMVFGKRTHLVCIAFSPIDWVETQVTKLFSRSGPEEN